MPTPTSFSKSLLRLVFGSCNACFVSAWANFDDESDDVMSIEECFPSPMSSPKRRHRITFRVFCRRLSASCTAAANQHALLPPVPTSLTPSTHSSVDKSSNSTVNLSAEVAFKMSNITATVNGSLTCFVVRFWISRKEPPLWPPSCFAVSRPHGVSASLAFFDSSFLLLFCRLETVKPALPSPSPRQPTRPCPCGIARPMCSRDCFAIRGQ